MRGFHFTKFDADSEGKSKFQQLLDLFMQLLTYTSGDVGEAMQWMNELDKQYKLTDDEYGMGDFIDELKEKGYITEENQNGEIKRPHNSLTQKPCVPVIVVISQIRDEKQC